MKVHESSECSLHHSPSSELLGSEISQASRPVYSTSRSCCPSCSRLQNSGAVWYEPMVKVHKPEKSPQFALSIWTWKVSDDLDFIFQWANTCGINMVTQKVQFTDAKLNLGNIDHDSMLIQSLKNRAKMFQMLFRRGTCDEEVVDISLGKIQTLQNLVHETLERLRSILQSKWHPKELEETKQRSNSSLGNVLLSYWNLMIGPY